VLVFTITCQPNFIGREMMERNASILAALRDVFDRYIITPGELAFVAAGGAEAALTASAEELVARYDARGVETPRFDALHFYNVLEEYDVEWVNSFFAKSLANEEIVANTDNRPAAYFKHHVFWRHEMRSGGGDDEESEPGLIETWLSGTGGKAPPLLLAPAAFAALGLLFLCGSLLAPRGGPDGLKRAGAAMARGLYFTTAAAAGFSGIVFEMGLLLSYQSAAGYLYSRMGVIIAAYMAGLALGSLLPCDRKSAVTPYVLSTIGTFVGAAAALNLPVLSGMLDRADAALLAYALVTVVLGASGGLAFRGAAVALERDGRSPGGTVYALDILGTCLGGVLAGSVLVPFIGIAGAFVVAGGLNLMLPAFAIAALVQRGASQSRVQGERR
jgi:spermidine synthase